MTSRWFLIIVLLLTVSTKSSHAYILFGTKWPTAAVNINVEIPGENGLWNTAFEDAMAQWNLVSSFKFSISKNSYADPCKTEDSLNGVAFKNDNCGFEFGQSVLAITQSWYVGNQYSETGIVFNKNLSWNVYSGPILTDVFDFRRVAIHELGHVIGLNHEDSVPSVMSTSSGNIISPQQDDINGVNALYGMSDLTTSTVSGIYTTASILGGVTNDGGITFGGLFASTDTVDILGVIIPEAHDINTLGSIYKVLIIGGQFLMKDSSNKWIEWDGRLANLQAADGPRILNASESITVYSGLTDLGLYPSLGFYIGYGDSSGDIHFNSQAIRFTAY